MIALVIACNTQNNKDSDMPKTGQEIYRRNCALCHGADGKLGVRGAKDLSTSPMGLDERINRIAYGKDLMTPFTGLLTDEEIRLVAEYTLTLK